MTLVTLPNRPLGSDQRAIALILADFDAIVNVVNGNIDYTNLASGVGRLANTPVSANTSMTVGKRYIVTVSSSPITMTLPTPVADGHIAVQAAGSASGTNQVIVAQHATDVILGKGLGAGAASLPLGAPGAFVELASDGTNWYVISGEQDSGWIKMINLATGFTGFADPEFPSSRLKGDQVYLAGSGQTDVSHTIPAPNQIAQIGTSAHYPKISTQPILLGIQAATSMATAAVLAPAGSIRCFGGGQAVGTASGVYFGGSYPIS